MTSSPFKIFFLITWPYFVNDFLIICGDIYEVKWPLYFDHLLYFIPAPLTIFWLHRKKKLDLSNIGWPKHDDFLTQEIYAVIYLLCFLAVFHLCVDPLVGALYKANPNLNLFSFRRLLEYDEAIDWWQVTYMSVSAGIYEELIFRAIYSRLFKGYFKRRITYYIFGGLIFALIHWSIGPLALIGLFLWGLLALLFYEWHRRLMALTVMHIAYDFIYFGRFL